MLHVDLARWSQTTEDLRMAATTAAHARTRERFLALYEAAQGRCPTQVASRSARHPQTVMQWVHGYNRSGPQALLFRHTGGRPPFVPKPRVRSGN